MHSVLSVLLFVILFIAIFIIFNFNKIVKSHKDWQLKVNAKEKVYNFFSLKKLSLLFLAYKSSEEGLAAFLKQRGFIFSENKIKSPFITAEKMPDELVFSFYKEGKKITVRLLAQGIVLAVKTKNYHDMLALNLMVPEGNYDEKKKEYDFVLAKYQEDVKSDFERVYLYEEVELEDFIFVKAEIDNLCLDLSFLLEKFSTDSKKSLTEKNSFINALNKAAVKDRAKAFLNEQNIDDPLVLEKIYQLIETKKTKDVTESK